MMSDETINDDQVSEPLAADWVRVLREEYNAAPGVPRDEMWEVIAAATAASAVTSPIASTATTPQDGAGQVVALAERRTRRGVRPWLGWAAAASLILWAGVGIGRFTAPRAAAPMAAGAAPNGSVAVRAIATEHMAETESLLQFVRTDARRSGSLDADVGVWGRELLSRTRLLMDSEGAVSPEMRRLLEDLELILVQVTLVAGDDLSPDRRREELELLNEDLEDQNVMPRLQAVVPALRPAYAGT